MSEFLGAVVVVVGWLEGVVFVGDVCWRGWMDGWASCMEGVVLMGLTGRSVGERERLD